MAPTPETVNPSTMSNANTKWADVAHHYAKSKLSVFVGQFDHGPEMGMMFDKGIHEDCDYHQLGMWINVKNGGFLSEWGSHKPVMYKLPDMTKEDAAPLIQILMGLGLEDEEDGIRLELDEIAIDEIVPNDNGLMMDADVAVTILFSCRCYAGTCCIISGGGILLYNEDEKQERIANMAQAISYLCANKYDLFDLINSSEAIDAKTLEAANP